MKLQHLTIGLASALFMTACATTAQYTSGKDYVARYDQVATSNAAIDQDIRDIANIEPELILPARIGLARVDKGRLTTIPVDEAVEWKELSNKMGPSIGEFVPVSPLVTSMVSVNSGYNKASEPLVNNIRRGSARQHLDYVLIYEVTDISKGSKNALSVTDLTILGLFVLPSRNVSVHTTASAMLIDVRNGYPYGTASAFAEKKAIAAAARDGSKKRRLSDKARIIAVEELVDEVEIFLDDLKVMSADYVSRY